MFHPPAWAVGSYSSGPSAAGAVVTKSTGGFYQADGSPCSFGVFARVWAAMWLPSAMVEHPKSQSTQPNSLIRWTTLEQSTNLLDVEGRDGLEGLGAARAHADGGVALKVGQVARGVDERVGEAGVVERVLHLLHPGRRQEHHERHEL